MTSTPKSVFGNTEESSCIEKKKNINTYSEFAEVCAFFSLFGEKLGLLLTFPKIARLLTCETDADLQSLTTLLVKLLNKMRFRTQLNRWQPSLGRFLQKYAYNSEDLASVGATLNVPSPSAEIASIEHPPPSAFFSLPPELRIRVVLFCCETQFHLNPLFKEKIKTMESPILRSRPFGSDIFGNTYWLLIDPEFNFLLYKGSASDETFSLASDAFNNLEALIEELKDEKYEKTPISTLYFPYSGLLQVCPKPEPLDETSIATEKSEESEEKGDHDPGSILKIENSHCAEAVAIGKPLEIKLEERLCDKEHHSPGTEHQPLTAEPAPIEATISPKIKAETAATTEVVQPAEDPESLASRNTKGTRAARQPIAEEAPGLRRSGRQRKQVEFLAMEAFVTIKSRSKKDPLPAGDEEKTQPHKRPRTKKDKRNKNKDGKGETKKNKQHHHKEGKKKRRKKKNGSKNGGSAGGGYRPPWSRSGSENDEQEEDAWTDAVEEMLNGDRSEDSSLSDRGPEKDWLEEVESDFDPNAEDDGGHSQPCLKGRNLRRHSQPREEEIAEEAPCQICTHSDRPEWLLLCDSCDLGFHAQCLRPPLHMIPEEDWFCPRCLHARLVTDLSEQLTSLQAKRKKVDSATRMQERLNFVNISVSNILRTEKARPRTAHLPAGGESGDEASSYYSSDTDNSSRSKRHRRFESASGSGDSSSSEEEEEDLPIARSTRHRDVKYNVNAAFEELDEVLAVDEKYASEKAERREAKQKLQQVANVGEDEEEEGDGQKLGSGGVLGPPTPPALRATARKKGLTSSSSNSSGSDSGRGKKSKRRKRLSSGSEDFRPSSADEDEEEEEVLKISGDSEEEGGSSDESWSAVAGRKRRGLRRRKSRHSGSNGRRSRRGDTSGSWLTSRNRRRGRTIPQFEGPSSEEDEGPRTRRSFRGRVNYREVGSSDEENAENAEKSSPSKDARFLSSKRASSGSEYAPSDKQEEEEEEEKAEFNEEDEEKGEENTSKMKEVGEEDDNEEPEISEDDEEMGGLVLAGSQAPEIDEHTSSPVKPEPAGSPSL